jgi:hypothetical protein
MNKNKLLAALPETIPRDRYQEENNGALSPERLRGLADNLSGKTSLLDGIAQPIDLNAVNYHIYTSVLPDLCRLAEYLGYGWYHGVNGSGPGQDYIFVNAGEKGDANPFHQVTGPGFEPNMTHSGKLEGYMSDKRLSLEFVNSHLTYTDPVFDQGSLRWVDEPQNIDIVQFVVDNLKGTSKVSTNFTCEYFTTGQAGAATQKSWQKGWSTQVTSNQTYNNGIVGAMFAKFSISLNESVGASGSTGGNQSTNTSLSEGTRAAIAFSKDTAGFCKGVYAVQTQSGVAAIDFNCMATLEYAVRFYGFLRWGQGKPFTGPTNYHNQFSGSGKRPTFDFTLGNANTPWWTALGEAVSMNASPWAWDKMIANYQCGDWLAKLVHTGKERSTFPIAGVTASMQRKSANWTTVSEEMVDQAS